MLKVCIKIMRVRIWNMMILEKCAVNVEMKKLPIYVLKQLKIKTEVNVVFSMKAKRIVLNALPKLKLFSFLNLVSKLK